MLNVLLTRAAIVRARWCVACVALRAACAVCAMTNMRCVRCTRTREGSREWELRADSVSIFCKAIRAPQRVAIGIKQRAAAAASLVRSMWYISAILRQGRQAIGRQLLSTLGSLRTTHARVKRCVLGRTGAQLD